MRPTTWLRAVAIVAGLVALVAVLGVVPGPTVGTSAADPADAIDADAADAAQRIVDDSTPAPPSSAPDPVRAELVDDPRPGDLRIDGAADILPADYTAPAAREVIRDIAYGPDDAQRLDLYLPDATDAPVIVYLHHGGWYSGSRDDVPAMVLRFLERGYAVASVGYRLAPDHPFPAPVHDVKRAIRELKVLGAASNLIDADSLVLYGVSAGGHLAAFAAATVGEFEPPDLTDSQAAFDSSVAGIVVNAGPTDLVELYEHPHEWARPMTGDHAGCDPCSTADLEVPSVGPHLGPGLPPAYWVYGELDPLVDAELQGRRMADAWAEAAGDGSSLFDLVDGEGHVLDETMVNQRRLEAFVDAIVRRADGAGI